MSSISRGFYVHYKGGVYFVQGTALDGDTHSDDNPLVVYESVQGCGDAFAYDPQTDMFPGGDPGRAGPRTRSVGQFIERVNPVTGEADFDGVPRFQRVVGWHRGVPLVMVDGRAHMFQLLYKGD